MTDVTWLDDAVSVDEPLEIQDQDTVENYYKDGNALFSVTIDNKLCTEAVSDIRTIIGDDNAMTGSAVSTAGGTDTRYRTVQKYRGGRCDHGKCRLG